MYQALILVGGAVALGLCWCLALIALFLRRKTQEVEHDLLGKHAYTAVRWALSKGEDGAVEKAIERLKAKFPDAKRDDIEEAILAMDYNARGGAP